MRYLSNNRPLVSVFMVTYNHAQFILEALESAVNQITDFKYEIIVGEDCSADGTREIVKSFQMKYPHKVFPIFHTTNIGIKANVESVFRACSGKYIAILEGDDYWTYSYKLQKQVDFLERNPGYSVCFHNAMTIHGQNKKRTWNYCEFNKNRSFELTDIIKRNFIPSASVMFRNALNEDSLRQLKNVTAGDWFLHIYNAQFGDIYYMHEFWAVYRAHDKGQWAGLGREQQVRFKIDSIFALNRVFNYKYEDCFRDSIVDIYANKVYSMMDTFRYLIIKIARLIGK